VRWIAVAIGGEWGESESEKVVEEFLSHNGIEYTADGGDYRFRIRSGAAEWNVACLCKGRFVSFVSMYPFAADAAKSVELCHKINGELMLGAAFRHAGTVYLRTAAEIIDGYTAYESVSRAAEYNFQAVVNYWRDVNMIRAGEYE
jgi:hypothetical protein